MRQALYTLPLCLLLGCAGSRPSLIYRETPDEREEKSDTAAFIRDLIDTTSSEPLAEPIFSQPEGKEEAELIWIPPDWDAADLEELDTSLEPPEEELMDPTQAHALLTQLANSFRRGAYGGELLPELQRVKRLSSEDSLLARVQWLDEIIAERDSLRLIEQIALYDDALREGRLDAARATDSSMMREIPHLQKKEEWRARRSSLERLISAVEQSCDPAECDRLSAEAKRAYSQKKYSRAIELARQASGAPDDLRRERAWGVLHSAGNAFCEEQRARAVDAIRLYQKQKEKSQLSTARTLLEECLFSYPEYDQRKKIESDIQAVKKMER